jgi:hypothetical protein
MRLLNASTLCVCDFIMRVYSTQVMLYLCGDYMVGKNLFLLRIMLQLLSVALPLELGAFYIIIIIIIIKKYNGGWVTLVTHCGSLVN